MESSTKLELIDQAIQKLLAEKRNKEASGDLLFHDDNDQILLSRLLSDLESLKGDGTLEQSESSAEQDEVNSPAFGEVESKNEKAGHVAGGSTDLDEDEEEILKELNKRRMEPLKGDGTLEQSESLAEQDEVNSPAFGEVESKNEKAGHVDGGSTEIGAEEIVKELRKVKKQNIITHCLLSAMIVLTFAWQLSEVSLVLKLKNGLSHPFRSFGSMITGMMKPRETDAQDAEKQQMEAPSIPVLLPPRKMDLDLDGE